MAGSFIRISINLARIQQVLNAAHQNDRKVAMIGHDVEKIVRTAIKLDKLHLPADDIFVDVKEINNLKDDQIVILQTGRSGETIEVITKDGSWPSPVS